MNKIITRRTIPDTPCELSESIYPLLRRVYQARGIQFDNELERDLKGLLPFQTLLNIDKAVACLADALTQQKKIMIVGDFDADGATSSALAVTCLKAFGAHHVDYIVPNRFHYGYGLTPEIVHEAAKKNPALIITVDNGISSVQGVETAKSLGISVLITDHHLPGSELPPADAIVNPNQLGDPFPSKHLAGVGVIFYVLLALRCYLRDREWFNQINIPEPNMAQFLDLVCLGTVADLVPLDQNNRMLVYQGLQRIRKGMARPGIKALLEIAKRRAYSVNASDLGFAVAPRLNAAGRLEDMSIGIECLITNDDDKARALAYRLNTLNAERREIEASMEQQALVALQKLHLDDKQEMPLGLCIYDKNWHQGVIGILAALVKEKFHRPVIAFANDNDEYIKGSARSIEGFHIRDALDVVANQYPNLIEKFGGHAMAAGLTIKTDNFSTFSQAFNEVVQRIVTEDQLQGKIYSDGELTQNQFSLQMAEIIKEGGPWGQHFPEPLFDGDFDIVQQRLVGEKHLKLVLSQGEQPQYIDAIAFNVDVNQWPNSTCKRIKAVYRLDVNEYNGLRSLQLIIEHLEKR